MRFLLFAIAFASLLACTSHAGPNIEAKANPASCGTSEDPLSCVKTRCVRENLTFDETQKICRCPTGEFLSTVGSYHCVAAPPTKSLSGNFVRSVSENTSRIYSFYLKSEAVDLEDESLSIEFAEAALLPLFGRGNQTITLHKNSESFRSASPLDATISLFGGPGVGMNNFLRSPELDLPNQMNGAVADSVRGMPFTREILAPRPHMQSTGDLELDSFFGQALAGLNNPKLAPQFLSFAETGCAAQCELRTILSENERWLAYRFRSYYGGVPVQDQISVFDKVSRETTLTAFLMDSGVYAFVRQEGDEAVLYGNDLPRNLARIGILQSRPAKSDVPEFGLDREETPVLLFEAAENADLVPVVVRGPFKDTHVFGWFREEDNLPFFKNYMSIATRFGEDDLEIGAEAEHGAAVARLATDGYRHAAIPFAGHDLLNGVFQKFLKNFNQAKVGQRLVASVSSTFILSSQACAASPLGQSVGETVDQVIWAISAGNSGSDLSEIDSACPQTLHGPNVLHVAATDGGDRIASASTYSERLVEIAEVGCPPEKATCSPQDAATSFAAPRVARKLSQLITDNPQVSLNDLRLAVLLTARMPYQWSYRQLSYVPAPLAVISGGILDVEAAQKLLVQHSNWPKNRDFRSKEWLKLLYGSKADQFQDVGKGYVISLLKYQMDLISKRSRANE